MEQKEQQARVNGQKQVSASKTPRPRVKTLGSILSAARDGVTKRALSKRLGVGCYTVESYLSTLCATGMLQQSSASANSPIQDQTLYTRTELGSKFLEAFVEVYRAAGEASARFDDHNNGKRSSNRRNGAATQSLQYLPCMACASHPSFAGIPPITLHHGAECEICHTRISA